MQNDSTPRWALITVTYNSSEDLRTYWRRERPADVEWIVVDNASRDDTVAVAESLGARVIRLDNNLGFGAANNVGMRESTSLYVAFVNPDVTIDFATLDTLEQLVEDLGGIVGPQLTNPDGSLQPNGRGLPTLPSKIRNRLPARWGNAEYQNTAVAGEILPVDWLIGAALVARRDTFEAIRGWDERFFVYYEDSDIGLRAWANGFPVTLVGDARWVHGWARETTKFRVEPWKRELASMAKFYLRYPLLLGPVKLGRTRFPHPTTVVRNTPAVLLAGDSTQVKEALNE